MTDTRPSHPTKRLAVIMTGGIAGIVVALAAVYGIATSLGNRNADATCGPAVEAAHRAAPLARGEVAAIALAERPLRLPDLVFHDAADAERRLSDWHGRTVLFNLWATRCVPCRKEMPALDALQAKHGGPN